MKPTDVGSRPEGVSQEAWDDANEAMNRAGWFMRSVRVECANAIQAATAAAYEDAARVADAYAGGFGVAGSDGEILPIPDIIAAAIRARASRSEGD